MKILTASPFETLFHPPKFTKNHNNQKIQLWQTSIFAREVSQKSFLTFPCCMGLVFFLIAMQRGNAISHFCDTSHARTSFFHVFHTSPAKSSKTPKTASWSHAVDVSARKMQNANRHKNQSLPRKMRSGRIFYISNNSIIQFIIVNIP